jgi:hemerythrin-like domain-containing protein
MNLFDTPAGFDEPIAMWIGCHRRIEKQLKTLAKLAEHVSRHGVDAEATSAAEAVLRYFEKSAPHHHEDEDEDLFPLLARRITDAGERERFAALRAQLQKDHEAMEVAWAHIRRPLHGIAEGLHKKLSLPDVAAFHAIYARHIPLEEGAIPDLAKRYLTPRDLQSLGRAMAERRGVAYPA